MPRRAYDRLLERGAWGVESRPGRASFSITRDQRAFGDSSIATSSTAYPQNDYGNTIYDVDFQAAARFEAFWRVMRRDPLAPACATSITSPTTCIAAA